MFIRLEREQDFTFYVQVLKSIIKCIFAFNHYNYARWFTIHVDDLMKLVRPPNVYTEFRSGNFVVRKTINHFSAIAMDQAHEQNNAIIKVIGGAVGLLSKDLDSALRCWEVAGPEVCRLLEEYKRLYNIISNKNEGKHSDDYTKFQKTFFNNTQKLLFYFNEICKLFEENKLVVLDTGDVMNSDAETCFVNLLERNEERYKEFYKHCLSICDFPITDTIKAYKLNLIGNVTTKSEKAQLQATELKSEEKFAQATTFSITHGKKQVKRVFSNKVTNFPSGLTEGGFIMYHSDLPKRFKQIP